LAVELDLVGARQNIKRPLHRFRVEVVAQIEKGN